MAPCTPQAIRTRRDDRQALAAAGPAWQQQARRDNLLPGKIGAQVQLGKLRASAHAHATAGVVLAA